MKFLEAILGVKYAQYMSIRYKIFLILGASQVLLLAALTMTFGVLITSVKNEPQNQRAIELARSFQRELEHKDEKLKLLVSELLKNPATFSILEAGLKNRNTFVQNQKYLQEIMDRYSLSIFEVGDRQGRVVYRVHRPEDYGDSKAGQPLIQTALRGQYSSTLETGHSGLGFRVTGPLSGMGTLLIGQVVDSHFAETISGKESVHLAIYEKDKMLTASSRMIENFLVLGDNKNLPSHTRIDHQGSPYYFVQLPYEDKGMSSMNLNFKILIDEKELSLVSKKIWVSFVIVACVIFLAIFFISYLFSRDIVNAVKSLNFAMKNIDLTKTDDIKVNRKDEIGQMSAAFLDMKKDLYQHQHRLEELVQQKTLELQNTLQDLRKIKEQQDGDYFLTSLLIKPLSGNKCHSENVSVETFERQKKVFTFRNKRSEIGGDLSVVQEIYLKGKKYIVFLNADAMGKSIQGAGGVLVMGTVFKSLITRTQQIPAMQERHPERWLKDSFLELQDVFVSFDGTMLLSAVIGLVDDGTGTIYYINAEHPWVVLYRDGKANFIENELLIRKIGFAETELPESFCIKVYQLYPGDVIIVGSDGRDDILMGEGSQGERLINEDETEFLKRVEEGGGSLTQIEKAILAQGELTDDFSLIRIGFLEGKVITTNGDIQDIKNSHVIRDAIQCYKDGKISESIRFFEEAITDNPDQSFCLRELSKLYIKTKEFNKAIDLSERYIASKPHDTDFLYYIAYAYKQKKSYEHSIDYAERLRLRDPQNVRNLVLLSELYMHVGNFERSESVLSSLRSIDPENPKLKRLSDFMVQKTAVLV